MGSTQVDLLDIVHVKVWFLVALKMCIRAGLGKFAWSTLFVQCGYVSDSLLGVITTTGGCTIAWSLQKTHICLKTPKYIIVGSFRDLIWNFRNSRFWFCIQIIKCLPGAWRLFLHSINVDFFKLDECYRAMEQQFCDLSESVQFKNMRRLIKSVDLSNQNSASH